MNCSNYECTIYKECKIKEVAEHCIIHKKMMLILKDCFNENGQINPNPELKETDEMVDSHDVKQEN